MRQKGCTTSVGNSAEWNAKFVCVVEQLVLVKESAEEIFSRIQRHAQQVSDRSDNLLHRLKDLETVAKSLPNPRTLKLDNAGSFSRYTSVECHFMSFRPLDSVDNVFCPATRPPALRKLLAAAGREGKGAPVTENSSTQTEDDPLFPLGDKSQSSCADSEKFVEKVAHARRNSVCFDQDSSLPTPEEQTSSIATIYKSTVVAVDTSGTNLMRISAARRGKVLQATENLPATFEEPRLANNGRERPPRRPRRNTVAITSIEHCHEQGAPEPSRRAGIMENQRTLSPIEDIGYPDEPTYDVLPFQKRRSRFLSANPFSSLRRAPKKPRESVIYGSLKRHPVSADTADRVAMASSESGHSSENIYGEFKRLIRRSVSMRLGQRRRKTPTESEYDEVPFPRANPAVVEYSKNSLKKKLSLPISTPSQVLHLATMMRSQPDYSVPNIGKISTPITRPQTQSIQRASKPRPLSIISASSNMSLEISERGSCTGWYRQGYQIDLPDEFQAIEEERTKLSNHSNCRQDSDSSGHSSPKDLIGDSSSDPGSNYSCDQEGYYTSMHRECGIKKEPSPTKPVSAENFRGRSFSTHSSSSTVAEKQRGDNQRPSSGDSGAEDLQSPVGSTGGNPSDLYASIKRVAPKKAFPPLCEVSLSGESDINSPLLRRNPLRRTMPVMKSPPALPPKKPQQPSDKFFDDWLLKKFQDELCLKGNDTYCRLPPPREVNYAVPVRKAVRFCE